ncbi:hypothetical protein [Gimesia sp.]|uniref:hypothetical protein n=1 Tax=Gimesia sp. TaxID=2024833 RepID=UPI003A9449F8
MNRIGWRYWLMYVDPGATSGCRGTMPGRCRVDPHDMFEQAFTKIMRKREALLVLTSTLILFLQVKKYWTTRATH